MVLGLARDFLEVLVGGGLEMTLVLGTEVAGGSTEGKGADEVEIGVELVVGPMGMGNGAVVGFDRVGAKDCLDLDLGVGLEVDVEEVEVGSWKGLAASESGELSESRALWILASCKRNKVRSPLVSRFPLRTA